MGRDPGVFRGMRYLLKLLCSVALLSVVSFADVPGLDKNTLAVLDAQIDKVMAGYNGNNWKAFYASGWADQTKALQTEQTFNTLYTNMYLKQFGTLKSKKLNEGESSFSPQVGLLVYNAEFSKKKGRLCVNFFKEGGQYKIQQLQVQP